jgi:hypothetical protein
MLVFKHFLHFLKHAVTLAKYFFCKDVFGSVSGDSLAMLSMVTLGGVTQVGLVHCVLRCPR